MASHTQGEPVEAETLQRGLSNRHIQLIAIGGAIGTGLFMGSGKTISVAGPSILFVYAIIGAVIFLVLRAMGELLLSNLNYKSFSDAAYYILGPMSGYVVGWSYWLAWVVVGIADVIAITEYVQFWVPDIAKFVPAVLLIIALLALNLPSVKNFGEIEFWFAMIKIVAIIALILVGLFMIFTGFESPSGARASVSNIWKDGGIFPHGFTGFLAGFQLALFAFFGAELVGTAAAETKDPEKTLPKAINAVPVRIILFYVLTLAVIISVTPWRSLDPEKSPFVEMFTLAGIGIAAHIINFVVLTSAMSSANSGIFSTSRMMYGLAQEGNSPKIFARLSKRGVPQNALFLSCVLLLSSLILLYSGDSLLEAFTVVTTVAALLAMFAWSMIVITYIVYRKKNPEAHKNSVYKMPGGVASCYFVLVFFAAMLVVLSLYEDTRLGLMVMPIWFILLLIFWPMARVGQSKVAAAKIARENRDA